MTSRPDGWPAADTEMLKQLWFQGLSAAQISRALGGRYSRNAVCGKAHRLVLGHRSATVSSTAQATAKRKASAPKSKPLPANTPAPEPIGLQMDFPNDRATCRFIHGEIGGTWTLCGHKGYPFCDFHRSRFFTKPLPPQK